MNDSEGGCFILGAVIMIASFLLVFNFVIDTKMPVQDVERAQVICAQNEGIKYLEWNLVNWNKVTCVNDGVFQIKRGQQ